MYVAVIDEDYLKVDEMTTGKYIIPVFENEDLFYLKLDSEKREPEAVLDCLNEIGASAEAREPGYELEIKSLVLCMWMHLYKEFAGAFCAPKKAELKEKVKLYKMLEFLHVHYKEKITLGEMAENSGVSTGEYCRFFKKRMEQTPFEYLQAYRIERSLPEILDKSDSITKIALKHGFTGSSYYAETFKKEMGCAPGDYRKWYRGEVNGACPLKQVKEELPEKKVEKQEPVRVRRESMPAHLL